MARSLHSDSLKQYTGVLPQYLESDLEDLREYLNKRELKILVWDDARVAIPFNVDVQLPSRGTYKNIDIRKKEDILLIFHISNYPHVAPRVLSNRKTFPKNGTSHLYVSRKGKPAPFCLVRGDYNEWFSDKRIIDLVIRAKNWLQDAASGGLVEDGNQFDPMRLEGYQGNIVYKYEDLAQVVENKNVFERASNFSLLLIKEREKPEVSDDTVKYPGYEVVKIIKTLEELNETHKPIIEKLAKDIEGIATERLLIGVIAWNEKLEPHNEFPQGLPQDLNQLLEFAKWANIELYNVLGLIPHIKFPSIDEVPLLLAVKRPKPIIGYSGDIEFFNFFLTHLEGSIDKEKGYVKNIPVGFQKHNEPLSIKKAQEISGCNDRIDKIVAFGCGAVGSKVMMHLIKEGNSLMCSMLFDHDKIEPHNMVRYGLMSESVGVNKAVAIEQTAKKLYPSDKDKVNILGVPQKGNRLFEMDNSEKLLDHFDWVMDFTASTAFENLFIQQNLQPKNRVLKASLFDEGKMGMLFIEGPERNPRIDDIRIMCQSDYLNDSTISSWLKREYKNSKKENTLVNTGVGCNSETTILGDDTVSIHSAAFVKALKSENTVGQKSQGIAYLTFVASENGFSFRSERKEIQPLRIFKYENSEWEVRMKAGLDDILMAEMGKAMPNETGGVLIGLVNNKTKCIHITDVVLAPTDSMANAGCFIRGVKGLKGHVEQHKNESGQTFGYVGEWHTHPHGPNEPSNRDVQTMTDFKKQYAKEGISIPVFIMIATPVGLITCIH